MNGVLKYTFNASINQGPSESIIEKLDMNTYDVVNVNIIKGTNKEISLLPDSQKGIKFFCISSDIYANKGSNNPINAKLTYVIKSNAATNPTDISIDLDRPHVLIGKSILDTVGNFSKLTIKNNMDFDVNVKIMIGRDV